MLTTERERKICEKYGAYDENGYVHYRECPLARADTSRWDWRCKANSHYDRKLMMWVYDDEEEGKT